jgi:transposase
MNQLASASSAFRLGAPNSPDLNPIEEMFSKLKRLLRKANERTVEARWRRIGKLLHHFSPTECANYIRGAGHASI